MTAITDLAPASPVAARTAPETRAGTVELLTPAGWFAVCGTDALQPGHGVAALLPGGAQAAVFKDSTGRLYAIGNVDPFTGAGVLCHGLTGSAGGEPYVASPLLKQRFALADGRCLDDDEVTVASYPLRVR
ncbi:nitrite reductase small subunit NirD [Actinacidiphila acidipaludis]|uniref:Nitrite reductase small subunit NirD n=1 Tax=Actinacidiphila acidipaludis TaxID=2873382 RepID=A0ABS7Q7H1_9ACTN|nr:nitrite reductase small subunit NirD [Streptomyces acidipaludis]MBY8877739.1 nitrite reductase small subunit NirD [Streptomyces acidipaludis]